jgi:type II secretory pathway component PulM
MDALLDRFRTFWDGLNDRERRMLAILGVTLGMLVLL